MTVAELEVVVTGKTTDLNQKLDQSKKQIKDFAAESQKALTSLADRAATGMTSLGRSLAIGVTLPVMAATGAVIKISTDFDRSLRNVDSLLKLSEQGFKDMRDSIIAIADDPKIRQMPGELAKGFYDIASSGFKGKQAVDVLRQSAYGASAGLTTTAISAKVLGAVLNSGIGGVNSARQAMDVLFKEVDLGVNSFEDLATQIGDVLPTATVLKVNLQEVAAAMATLTRKGISAAESSTAINQMLIHIIKPSEDAKKIMNELGIEFGVTALKSKGLAGWLDDVMKKTKGNKQLLVELMPEVRALRSLLNLTNDDGKLYNDMLAQMMKASEGAGATANALARQNKGVGATFDTVKKDAHVLAIELGEVLAPFLLDVIKAGKDLVRQFRAMTPEQKENTLKAIALAAAIGPLVIAFGKVAGAIVSIIRLKSAYQAWSAATVAANLAVAGSANTAAGAQLGLSNALKGLPGLIGRAAIPLAIAGGVAMTIQSNAEHSADMKARGVPPWRAPVLGGSSGGSGAPLPDALAKAFGLPQASRPKTVQEILGIKPLDLSTPLPRFNAKDVKDDSPLHGNISGGGKKGGGGGGGGGGGTKELSDAQKALNDHLEEYRTLLADLTLDLEKNNKQKELGRELTMLEDAIVERKFGKYKGNTEKEWYAIKAIVAKNTAVQKDIAVTKELEGATKNSFSGITRLVGVAAIAIKKYRDDRRKEAQDAIADARRELDMRGLTTAAEVMHYQITKGKYKDAPDVEKAGLMDTAKMSDAATQYDKDLQGIKQTWEEIKKALTDASEAALEARTKQAAQYDDYIAGLREEGRLLNLNHDQLIAHNAVVASGAKHWTTMAYAIAQALKLDKLKEFKQSYEDFARRSTDIMLDGIGHIKEGFGSMFKNIIKGFGQMLADMAKQYLANYILRQVFGMGSGKTGGGLLGAIFGGGKGVGGPVNAGQPYMVGEYGPELFVPNSGGSIKPNERSGGGGGATHITMNITTPNPGAFRNSESQMLESLARKMAEVARRNR